MKRFTLTNNVHNTRITVRVEERPAIGYELSRHQVRRIRLALCPVAGCGCGHNHLKMAGPQHDARVERLTWNACAPVYVLHDLGQP